MSERHILQDETPAASVYEVIELPPPVFTGSQMTRTQPENSNRNGMRNQRRPIPISTQDWISTTRSQFSPISAEYFLTNVEQVEIQPIVDINTLLGHSGKKFRVKMRGAETLFLATENSSKYQRNVLGTSRSFVMDVRDPSGEPAFILTKGLTWGCVPGFLHSMTVETTEYIGCIQQNFTLFGPRFTVYDASSEAMCIIDGPNMCCCCMSNEVYFQVLSTDMSRQIASISHQYDHLLVDHILLLTFPNDANVRLKSLLMAATFFMGALYFDRLSNSPASRPVN
ncbi:phospholipid scramblase 4-like [Fopius arisanus]|uniref:Phospholipid scramblase n=1 Tax=Fopius arisanus TaxID=64838 RepID=A0A9R1U094_9HYME|nr:PREDICTED: phospholipid scramblase 4-like [Fopius arisanus]